MFLNGEEVNKYNGFTIEKLLKQLELNEHKVVVEIDNSIILQDKFKTFKVDEKNKVEIISFVGGG